MAPSSDQDKRQYPWRCPSASGWMAQVTGASSKAKICIHSNKDVYKPVMEM